MEVDARQIGVMVVDDRLEWISTIELIVSGQEDMVFLGSARDQTQALALATATAPRVAFVDLHLQGENLDGLDLTRELSQLHPDTSVVILTVDDGEAVMARAVEAGAVGYIYKDSVSDPQDLCDAIRAIASGASYFRQGDVRKIAEHLRKVREHVDPKGAFGLTPRQLEVLVLIAEGMNNAEISERLVITLSTTKNHVAAILRALNVSSRAKAGALARDSGVIGHPKRQVIPED